jgi:glycosyltransferase 2 family protein
MAKLNSAAGIARAGVAILAIGFGAVLFWLSARHTNAADIREIATSANYSWIALGIMLFGVALGLRMARWRHIIGHQEVIEFFTVARGMMAGYALNILLPARLGELFRADYTSRLSGVDRGTLLASVFVERVIDLAMVVFLFAVGLFITGVHDVGLNNILVGAVVVIACCSIFVWLMVSGAVSNVSLRVRDIALKNGMPVGLIGRVSTLFKRFLSLMRFVTTRRFFEALALSIPIWSFELLALWSICRAIGLVSTVGETLTLLGSASLSTLIPTAPGFLGTYQFAFVVVLRNFGVSEPRALVAATATQVFLMFLFALLGLIVWTAVPVWLNMQNGVGARQTAKYVVIPDKR